MSTTCPRLSISLFARTTCHSSFLAQILTVAARGCGPALVLSQRTGLFFRTSANKLTRWWSAWIRTIGASVAAILFAAMSVSMAAEPALSAEPKQAQPSTDQFADFVLQASHRFNIPAIWIRTVLKAESAGEVHAISPAGAMGLMQLMPETWLELRARYGLGTDPFDPHDNIFAGAAYLRELYDHYGSPGFLAAYHAGLGRYDEHVATGRPMPDETTAYLAAVLPAIDGMRLGDRFAAADLLAWRQAPLFVVRSKDASTSASTSKEGPTIGVPPRPATAAISALVAQSDGLFVPVARRSRQP